MPARTIDQKSPRLGRLPSLAEGALRGAVLAVVAGIVLAAIFGELEGVILLGLVLPPPLGVLGAVCGAMVTRRGWTAVMPLVLPVCSGLLVMFTVRLPAGPEEDVVFLGGWVFGGLVGGLSKGIASRSIGRGACETAIGVTLGAVGWLIFDSYLTWVLNWLNGNG